MMTDKLEILRAYQSWRRGDNEHTMQEAGRNPHVIGAAIDWAIAELEKPRPAVPDKIAGYPGYLPPEHGEAGAYYVEGWNDCREEMLNAAPKPPGDSGWQPIETAPKDGTPIYVRRPAAFVEDFCHVVTWDAEDEWWQVHDGKFFHPLRGDAPREWRDIEPAEGGEV